MVKQWLKENAVTFLLFLALIGLSLITIFNGGCSAAKSEAPPQPGRITFTIDGYGDAQTPPKVELKQNETTGKLEINATTGKPNKMDLTVKHLRFLPYLGAGSMLLGFLLLGLKFKFPILPTNAAWAMVGAGILCIFLPTIVDRFGVTGAMIVLGAAVLVYILHMTGVAISANRMKKRLSEPEGSANVHDAG